MLKPLKTTMAAAGRQVPILWRETGWSVRMMVRPFATKGQLRNFATVLSRFTPRTILPSERYLTAVERRLVRPGLFGGDLRYAPSNQWASRGSRRNSQRNIRTVASATFRRQTPVNPVRRLSQNLEPLLALAALPLGGSTTKINLRHLFDSTQPSLL